jgi:hypothetical protein
MRDMREEMGIETWEAWDMLHQDGAWWEAVKVDTAQVAEPQEAGHWPDYGVCELRLHHEPVFDIVWLWDADVESHARSWWDEGTCPMGDARFAKAENVEVEWDSRGYKEMERTFASWHQVYPQHHLPFPFAFPLAVREISIPILCLWSSSSARKIIWFR